MKKYFFLVNILFVQLLGAQVIIGGSTLSNPYVQLELQNTTGQKVLVLPAANDSTTLPKYNPSQLDQYDDDNTMEGMLMYDKNAKVTKVYNGSMWGNAFIPNNKATNWTRARIESSSAGCISLLCSSGNLNLTIPTNTVNTEFADYLSILQSSSMFKIRQKGLYRINFNLMFGGVNIGLTGVKVNISIIVNGEEKGYMSADAAFLSSSSFLASSDTVLFLNVNDSMSFRVSINNGGLSATNFTFGGSPESSVSVEQIL